MKPTVLIIDDNVKLCQNLYDNFQSYGFDCVYTHTGTEGLQRLRERAIPVVILDLQLQQENGLDVLQHILTLRTRTAVIMLTGYGTIETAVEAIKLGAFDFLQKPVKIDKLIQLVRDAIAMTSLPDENGVQASAGHFFDMVSQNVRMRKLNERAMKIASSELPVLICGESGTGKELLADFIHAHSARAQRPLLKINCAAFPEQLLDNELFGHEKGAFTGADAVFQGLFEQSHNGSLFLDELGDMPLALQAKILRVIQNQEIRRLGGKETITINVRFITATNKDLQTLMNTKQFREDLYYRLSSARLFIPALRERRDDILLLANHFLRRFSSRPDKPAKTLHDDVIKIFMSYDWPGNVRELKNTVHYAATVCEHDCIMVEDLPPDVFGTHDVPLEGGMRDDVEKALILETLKKADGNKKKAANMLNISRSNLYLKIQKYGIPLKTT